MKTTKSGLAIGVAAVALLILFPARPASAQNTENGRATRYRVLDLRSGVRDVYVRSGRKSFVRGTLFEREHFDVQYRINSYGWGYAHGDVNLCGWAPLTNRNGRIMTQVSRRRGDVRPRCPAPPRGRNGEIPLGVFMEPVSGDPMRTHDKNSLTCPDGKESACDGTTTTLSRSTTFYRNVNISTGRPVGRRSFPLSEFEPGTDPAQKRRIKWRYLARGRRFTMIKAIVNGKRFWGFVLAADIASRPVDPTGCRVRESCN